MHRALGLTLPPAMVHSGDRCPIHDDALTAQNCARVLWDVLMMPASVRWDMKAASAAHPVARGAPGLARLLLAALTDAQTLGGGGMNCTSSSRRAHTQRWCCTTP